MFKKVTILSLMFLLISCQETNQNWSPEADEQGHSPPSQTTAAYNQALLKQLPFENTQDFEDAQRGLIDTDPDLKVKGPDGQLIWNMPGFDFIQGEAPASVNPSLWRQAKLNQIHGLFKVTDRVYQLRGYDLANLSIIEGDEGLILVDPLTAQQTAAKALQMVEKHFPDKPIKALIYTHSHMDHFGGSLGLFTQAEAQQQNIRIIAPAGFLDEATQENIIAGPAMARRSMFMYGKRLAQSERGQVGSGLGKHPAYGTFGILAPTETISHTGEQKTIDGVRFIFQHVPGSEAPAEMTFYLPELKAFCGAELVSKNLHNLYTLRGTKVRDAVKWSGYINEAMTLFADAEVYFGSHHWPTWGQQAIQQFLQQQRDTYKFIHDQTVRMFNQGMTAEEIAEQIQLPTELQSNFSNRGYYGTVRHNAKAVYQNYLGWYNGIPAALNRLPPEAVAAKYMAMMGGVDQVLQQAQLSFDEGEYRWVAELLQHAVFAEPDHAEVKELLAQTYDQLGYQAESGPWRNVYLSAAYELRHGGPEKGVDMLQLRDILYQTPVSYFFDSMAVRLNADAAEGMVRTIKIHFTDLDEYHQLKLQNSVLHHQRTDQKSAADATLSVTKNTYIGMLLGEVGLRAILFSDDVQVDGSTLDLLGFFRLFDKPKGTFNIITP